MNSRFLQVAITVYVSAALLFFLTSCNGGSSDPLEKYSVKGGPVTDEKSENQTKAGSESNYFSVDVGDLTNGRSASFVEGQDGQVLIKIVPKSTLIKNYSLSVLDFPHQQAPKIQNTSTASVYALLWKAPAGIIPPGALGTELQATVVVSITESTDPRLINVAESIKIHMFITKNITQPEILNFSSLEKGIDEGTQVQFIVDVNDPASVNANYPPSLVISSYLHSNTEAFTADGRHMVQPDMSRKSFIENMGNGKWRFYYLINAESFVDNQDRKGNVDPNANSVPVCFILNAESVNKSHTFNRNICFTGRYAAQMPLLNWDEQNPSEIKSGTEATIKFSFKSANGLGTTEIKDQTKLLSGLSGAKNLKCDADSSNSLQQNCAITWTPSCTRSNAVKKLTIKIENKLNDKIKSASFDKDITVLSNEELCPIKKPAQQKNQNTGVVK